MLFQKNQELAQTSIFSQVEICHGGYWEFQWWPQLFQLTLPTLVTDIVRNNGVSGNWVWWAFLLTGLLTVFVYAKLWRRSDVSTDMEFYELRYSGIGGKFLRGFRAIYLGVILM